MPLLRCTFAAVFVALALACGGFQGVPVPADQSQLVGVWKGVGYDLTVTADGGVQYAKTSGGSSTSVNGPVKVWGPGYFEVGVMGMNTRFDVQVPPHQDGGVWKMTIDGVEVQRVMP